MRKKPPSRIRYERSHPVVSARLDRETYEKLREMVRSEGKGLAGFLKDFVKRQKEGWDGAYQKGYEDGMEKYKIWYYCSVCGEKIIMFPDSNSHNEMIEYMKEHRWGHSNCIEKM